MIAASFSGEHKYKNTAAVICTSKYETPNIPTALTVGMLGVHWCTYGLLSHYVACCTSAVL